MRLGFGRGLEKNIALFVIGRDGLRKRGIQSRVGLGFIDFGGRLGFGRGLEVSEKNIASPSPSPLFGRGLGSVLRLLVRNEKTRVG